MALCLIQDSIDYSLFHYIVEADTPKKAWDTLKEVFSEEPTVEESHPEVEDSQNDCVYEDHVIPAKDFDGSIEVAIVAENEQQLADSTKETCSPPQN